MRCPADVCSSQSTAADASRTITVLPALLGPFTFGVQTKSRVSCDAMKYEEHARMKLFTITLCLFFASAAGAQTSVPQIAYRSVPDFLKLPPDIYLGEAAGVAVNSKGHIF